GTTGDLYVDNTGGQDSLNVGSGGVALNGNLANIQGWVDAFGTGSTALYLGDGGDTVARTVTLTDGGINGLAPAPISWSPSSGSGGGVTAVTVVGSPVGSTYTVQNTSNLSGATTLRTGIGFDTVSV